jgi:hypothetical protein
LLFVQWAAKGRRHELAAKRFDLRGAICVSGFAARETVEILHDVVRDFDGGVRRRFIPRFRNTDAALVAHTAVVRRERSRDHKRLRHARGREIARGNELRCAMRRLPPKCDESGFVLRRPREFQPQRINAPTDEFDVCLVLVQVARRHARIDQCFVFVIHPEPDAVG